MRRFRGIPYMNEFRGVKHRDRRLGPSNFMLQSPATLRIRRLCHRDIHAAVRGRARPRIALCNSGQTQAAIAFFIWENFRCDVIYLGSLLLPDIH
jgi:hypothetical protein